jgi:putative oxidoreductase
MDFIDKILRAHGAMVGRMLIGLLFVFSGIGIVLNGVDGFVAMIETRGLPMASLLAWVVVLIKIVAGGALMLGYKTKEATLALLVFTLLATILYHMNLDDINLFKNLAIVGGLLYVYIYGPGQGWKLKTS